MTDLNKKIAVVTGAAGGLGQAISRRLATAGATVVLADICEPARLESLAQEIAKSGCKAFARRTDVSSSADVDALFAEVKARFGTVHILVNNAAIVPAQPEDEARRAKHYGYITTPVPRDTLKFTSQMSDEDWRRFWAVNVDGVFYGTRAALRLMEPQRSGRIVNVASVAGYSPISAHSPHYSATKGAVIAFSKAVAAEVAGANIFVNVLAPGGIMTPDFKRYLDQVGEEKARQLWQVVPLGRLGTPEEYAETVLHLVGADHYLVGQVISPNGGSII
ncbi:MAG: SDR family NAD(P)-dependent oxidoreductase [Ottowia sp.]|uniref:SDR family NAD(P)-dependent oxidoreductase n=1 Tax=unclassified Ottowia TaxID=2645081 RepID=UPI003C2D7254